MNATEKTLVTATQSEADKDMEGWFASKPKTKKEDQDARRRSQALAASRTTAMVAPSIQQQGGTLGAVMTSDLACMPASLPATRLRKYPMTADAFLEDFGPDFSITSEGNVEGTGFVSKFSASGGVLQPFILRSICLVGRVDPMAFSLTGGAVPTAAVGTTPGAGIAPRVPVVVPPTGTAEYPGLRAALFEYGHAGWQVFMDFLRAYRFLYVINNRLLMINERGIDMGVLDSNAHIKGFGTGQIDPMPHIREANAHARDIGLPFLFVPSNVSEYATVAAGGAALPPVLADVQYGSPCAPGVYGACFPVTPHVIFPGQNPQMIFSRGGPQENYDRIREAFLGTGQSLPDPAFAPTNVAAGAPPITLGHIPFRYGTIEIGVLLKGAELMPADCLAWFLMFGQPYESLLRADTNAWNQLTNMATSCGLDGIPKPLGPMGVDPRWEKTSALGVLFKTKLELDGSLAGFEPSAEPGENLLRAREVALQAFACKGYLSA